jgi:hypothetical protein
VAADSLIAAAVSAGADVVSSSAMAAVVSQPDTRKTSIDASFRFTADLLCVIDRRCLSLARRDTPDRRPAAGRLSCATNMPSTCSQSIKRLKIGERNAAAGDGARNDVTAPVCCTGPATGVPGGERRRLTCIARRDHHLPRWTNR